MTNVEACEDAPSLAFATNCHGPAALAHLARTRKIPFVYVSTEYVFDGVPGQGAGGPYSETDSTHPLNVYGRSKYCGELAVLDACPEALVVRTTVVFGADPGRKNFLYGLIASLASGRRIRVPSDQISTPTYNVDLARAIASLVFRGASGIYHVCGPDRIDRLQLARTVAARMDLDSILIAGVPTSALGQRAPRPLAAGLSVGKLRQRHPDLVPRSLQAALSDCLPQLKAFADSAQPATALPTRMQPRIGVSGA
jgi:dTDP-4-dehydrorhamnose reductase